MEGQRGRRSGDCATVDRIYSGGLGPGLLQRATRAAKSIVPMNFPGQTLAAQGLDRLGATHTTSTDGFNRDFPRKFLLSGFISNLI